MDIQFPPEYFRPEIRNGFYVDGMMKRIWAASLKIMAGDFADVCSRYDIPWFADSGTLLGAVRHKGYIPWDDDIDVVMLRDDYTRFKQIMYEAFPPQYTFLTYDNPDRRANNSDLLTRVISTTDDFCFEEPYLSDFCGCPYTVGIDVFPADFIPDDPEEAEEFRNICRLLSMGCGVRDEYDNKDNEIAAMIKEGIEQGTGYHFNDTENLENQCIRLSEAVFSMYHRDECSRAAIICYWAGSKGLGFQKDWFLHPEKRIFEGVEIPVPGHPEEYLSYKYGSDYMVPNRNFPSHDYPYYKKFEKKLIKAIGRDPFYYHIDSSAVDILKNQADKKCDSKHNKRILFVVPKSSDWKYMEFYYDRLVAEGDSVYAMPVPFFDCTVLREPVDENYEYSEFPQGLNLVEYNTTDIASEHYDEIVISFPYDEFNYSEMIEERYFSRILSEQTDRLVYISPFETDDTQAMSDRDQEVMRHYVMVPGIIYADDVYVQSEAMKEAYISRIIASWKEDCEKDDSLKAMSDESEIRSIFSKKIKIKG